MSTPSGRADRRPEDPIPVCLVTGFLGSGKTTLLLRLAERRAGERIVYLVNDFASVSVDAQRLAHPGRTVVEIPGGSIFCQCLVTDFLAHLRRIADEIDAPDAPVSGVVIEASGMADPRVIGRMLRETRLDKRYRLARIVAVIEPGRFPRLLRTLPSVGAQVECADLVLINRCDLYANAEVEAVEAEVRTLRSGAVIHRTVGAALDFEPFPPGLPAPAAAGEGAYAPCRDPEFRPETLAVTNGDVDLDALRGALEALVEDAHRAKGTVRSGGRWWEVDLSGERVTVAGSAHPRPRAVMTVILRGAAQPDLGALRALLSADGPFSK